MKLNFDDLLKLNHDSKIILNDSYEWHFLDEYTFTEWIKNENCPSYTCYADGIVTYDGKTYAGRIFMLRSDDLTVKISGALYVKNLNTDVWEKSVNIVSVEV